MPSRLAANLWVAVVALQTQTRTMRRSPVGLILGIVQPVVFLVIAAGPDRPHPARSATAIVVGVSLTALWGSTIWAAGGILRNDLFGGTLARCVIGVRSLSLVFFSRCLGATVRSIGVIAASTVVTALVLGLPLPAVRPDLLLLGGAVVALSATALGMLLSCLFLVTKQAAAWSAVLMYPVFIVSGMIIPLDLLPAAVRGVSALISLRWAAKFLITSAGGAPGWSAFAALVALTGAYLLAALSAFGRLLDRARREGLVDYGA